MNESMTSIADQSIDPDDDLSRISPELALVDPELAQRLRERASAAEPVRPAPGLRLLPSPDPGAATEAASATEVEAPPVVDTVPGIALARAEDAVHEPPSVQPPVGEPVPLEPGDAPPVAELRPRADVDRSSPTAPARPTADADASHEVRPPWTGREPEALAPAEPVPPARPSPARVAHAAPIPVSRSVPARTLPARSRRPWWRHPGVQGFLAGGVLAVLCLIGVTTVFDDGSTVASPAAPTTPTAGGTGGAAATATPSVGATTPVGSLGPKVAPPPATATTPPRNTRRTPVKKAAARPSGKKTARKSPPPAAETRRFAWAPVDGASRYHVELFRGSDRVLARETVRPTLELASSWRHQGRVVRLTPGQYRWYVWPVTREGRAAKAVVQARLSIP